jgi:hypothetical protein
MVFFVYGGIALVVGGVIGLAIGRFWSVAIPPTLSYILWLTAEPDNQSGDLGTTSAIFVGVFGAVGALSGAILRRSARQT